MIAEGRSTKQVAFELDVSTKTVETHRRNIMRKTSVDNVAELTKYAIRWGLTTLDD
jgi:DNA-binding NarL/FixJ family response regulator